MVTNQDEWQVKKGSYFLVALICFFIGLYVSLKVGNDGYLIKPEDLTTIDILVVSQKPEFKETKGKRARKWIEFKCQNNKTTFEIASFDYSCANDNEIVNEVDNGDTISIKILETDSELLDSETSCEIHSLINKNKEYLNIACRNKAENRSNKILCIVFFAIAFLTFMVFLFPNKPDVDPAIPILIVAFLLYYVLARII